MLTTFDTLPSPWAASHWMTGPRPDLPPPDRDPPGGFDVMATGDGDPRPWRMVSQLTDPNQLLRGNLAIHRRGPERGRPCLFVVAYCQLCRHDHCFPWPEDAPLDVVMPVKLPCRDSVSLDRPAFVR